jgi:hypothetical protein
MSSTSIKFTKFEPKLDKYSMQSKKINVAVLFGGRSTEHQISLLSAKNVIDAMDREKFNPVLICYRQRWQMAL